MRRIAVINQKGGVGKTTTSANLGAALALQGRRVVLVDVDAQANLSLSLDCETPGTDRSTYGVLIGRSTFAGALKKTSLPRLELLPSNIDLSGAEMELASQLGREYLLRDALREWESAHRRDGGRAPAEYVIFDCPPSLGLLSINALAAANEIVITLQTEFLALQGMSKLVEIVQLLRRRLNPELVITGILPCLYDSRLRLAREVLGEIRAYFPGQVFKHPIRANVKLAEAPSYGKTIFEYAPDSNGAQDYLAAAREVIEQEARDPDLAGLPPFDARISLPPIDDLGELGPSVRATAAAGSRRAPNVTPGDIHTHPAQKAVGAPAEPGLRPASPAEPSLVPSEEVRESPVLERTLEPGVAGDHPSKITVARVLDRPSPIEPEVAREETRPVSYSASPAESEMPVVTLEPRAPDRHPRLLRAEDLPALPPDAFEILTNYTRSP